VAKSRSIFVRAIRQMTISDAARILRGSNTAATEYFRRKTQRILFKKMLPVTQKATNSTGLSSAYKKMVSKFGFMRQW